MRKQSEKAGLPPGSLIHVGERKSDYTKVSVMNYNEDSFTEYAIEKPDEWLKERRRADPAVCWLNVDGFARSDVLVSIGEYFEIHPLTLEDILNTEQRPKAENFGQYVFLVIKMLAYNDEKHVVETEQVSLVLGDKFVLSFQEREGDPFDAVRERLRNIKGKMRSMGADYLAYSLFDAVVDGYFSVLEKVGERIEYLEEKLVSDPSANTLQELHRVKREMIFVRRSVWPLRELLSKLEKAETPLIGKTTTLYLRDVYDHVVQIIDTTEIYREMLSSLLDIYLSSVNNKMNEVMKVLTVIATIFIPLTFIAGVYGMNFRFMPELDWPLGYPLVLLIMMTVAGTMLFYFRKKDWL